MNYENVKTNAAERRLENKETIKNAASRWISSQRDHLKPSTRTAYYSIMTKYVWPEIGTVPISEFNEDCMRSMAAAVFPKITSVSQLNKLGAAMIGLLSSLPEPDRFIILWRQLLNRQRSSLRAAKENSASGGGEVRPGNATMRVLSQEDQQLLEEVAMKSERRLGVAVLMGLFMGLRIGEICGLKWSDVDWRNRILTIRRTVNRVRRMREDYSVVEVKEKQQDPGTNTILIEGPPKTKSSCRELPIPAGLMEVLEEWYKSPKRGKEYIVCTRRGTVMEPKLLAKCFRSMILMNDLPGWTHFHTLRHCFATRALECGMDVKTLSELMGHSEIGITLNIYSHCLMQQKRQEIELLERFASARDLPGAAEEPKTKKSSDRQIRKMISEHLPGLNKKQLDLALVLLNSLPNM